MVLMSDIVKSKTGSSYVVNMMTEARIKEVQSYYDEGHPLVDCVKKFGHGKSTLIKYLKTRQKKKASEDVRKLQIKKNVIEWRIRRKKELVDYKGGKCIHCGYNRCINNLLFHHRDPSEKEFQISGSTYSIERLKKEVDKCDLVCCNCHGEVHAGLL